MIGRENSERVRGSLESEADGPYVCVSITKMYVEKIERRQGCRTSDQTI